MKKNGFTLVELLAIIVILAIIALITTTVVGDIIESSRKKTFEDSVVLGIYNSIEIDFVEKGYTTSQTYTITNNTITNTTANPNYSLTYNGKINSATGTANVTYNNQTGSAKIVLQVQNDNYCAKNSAHNGSKEFDITKGNC